MKKERLFYLDFIRAFATLAIVLTHFNALFIYNTAQPMKEKAVITTEVANVYIGGFGVSLFLIISGAALMYVYSEKIDVKNFYWKRAKNIFPMFWIAYFFAFLYQFYYKGGFDSTIPRRNILFSVFGLDLYVANFSIRTFATIGEWFLGLIIMIYLLFPLLRKGVAKYPYLTAGIAGVLYIISISCFDRNVLLFARLPEFLFGMFFVQYMKKSNKFVVLGALLVLVVNSILKPTISENIQCTYVGISSFLILSYVATFIRFQPIKRICKIICAYSYPCYLVHHYIIYRVAERFDLNTISKTSSYLLFLCCCIAIAIFTYLLDKITTSVTDLFMNKHELL